MDIMLIENVYHNFNERFREIDELKEKVALNIRNHRTAVQKESASIIVEMGKKVEAYVKSEIDSLDEKFVYIADRLSNLPENLKTFNYDIININDYSSSLAAVIDVVSEVNAKIEELNAFNFDLIVPPLKFEYIDNEKTKFEIIGGSTKTIVTPDNADTSKPIWNKEPAQNLKNDLYMLLQRGRKAVANLKVNVLKKYDLAGMKEYLNSRSQMWMADLIDRYNATINDLAHEKLDVEDGQFLSSELFDTIYSEGKACLVDPNTGSYEFSEKLKLFSVTADMLTSDSYSEYVEQSPIMSKYIVDGKYCYPFVVDLKKCGNIYLEIDEPADYGATAFKFIHNVILHYLMSQPAGRLNLCLIDPENKGDFAKYTKLKAINENILCNGIVRYERDMDATLEYIEKTMYDVYDNKISFNDVSNVFEYNNKSESNPQSLYLMVLLNYPHSISKAANQKLLNIIAQGNRSGICTLVVDNVAIHGNNMPLSPEKLKESVESMKKNMHCIYCEDDSIQVEGKFENAITIENEFDPEHCSAHIATLQNNAKHDTTRKVIKLERMYKQIDDDMATGKVEPSSEIIEIPIGMRGGEVLSVKLSTTGVDSAHMVVIGGTGSGKSNLLHTIIMASAYKYSPREYNIYLVDFKGGVEFKYYQASGDSKMQLPHIKLTGLTSDPEDGVAILANVQKELRSRENLFRTSNVEDIVRYNANIRSGKLEGDILPRLLLVIDEVQELFERNEMLGQTAINIMSELFKKGRAFGISILWASQNVPKVAGLRDKIISQIGNRICLKLNNPDDSQDIDISPQKVRDLNRPEKGLGIIKDVTSGNDNIEFRVAYAEDSDKRRNYDIQILDKWKDECKGKEPIFVVGSSERPHPNKGISKYNVTAVKERFTDYGLSLGHNYITGKDYQVNMSLRGSKSNMWMAGSNIAEIRDIMGYAMLSVALNNLSSSDMTELDKSIYYINGEMIDPTDPEDLFYVLPNIFPEQVAHLHTQREISQALIELYRLRKKRVEFTQHHYDPIYIFINKIQAYADLFKDHNKLYDVEAKAAEVEPVASSSGSFSFGSFSSGLSSITQAAGGGSKMTFSAIFNEILSRGSDVNIHVVFSIDTPSSISEINAEMKAQCHKIVLKGVRNDDMLSVFPHSRTIGNIINDGLCYCYNNDEMVKFKPYRYNAGTDREWLDKCIARVRKL